MHMDMGMDMHMDMHMDMGAHACTWVDMVGDGRTGVDVGGQG